jgi:hypothetical protein
LEDLDVKQKEQEEQEEQEEQDEQRNNKLTCVKIKIK